MNFVTLESQSDFPREDVTENNADMLELLLLHDATIELSHISAEKISYLYRLGHKTLVITAEPHFDDSQRSAAFSQGIKTFEAIAALIRPDFDISKHGNKPHIDSEIIGTRQHLTDEFMGTVEHVRDQFTSELPRTKTLIGQSATRFCRNYQDYAITGAAVARWLELDATSN